MVDTLVYRSMFIPNTVSTPSAARLAALHTGSLKVHDASTMRAKALPPTSKGVRLQISAIQILDGMQGILGTNIGAATGAYVISSVVDGTSAQPISFKGDTYQNIQNGQMLPLGQEGDAAGMYNVYLHQGQPMPSVLSFSLLVLRSNSSLRQLGDVIKQVQGDDRFKSLADLVKTTLTATTPVYAVVWQAAQEVLGLFGSYLQTKPDDQLGYYQANYTDLFDNLGAGHHPTGAAPTMVVDKIAFGYQIDYV